MISRKGLHDAARAAPRVSRTTHTFEVPDQGAVIISRTPKGAHYTLTYGKQSVSGLNYEEAMSRLGSFLMHALGCNGFHDGNPEYSDGSGADG